MRIAVLLLLSAATAHASDRGIYSELSAKVEAELASTHAHGTTLRVDRARNLATLYDGDAPQKLYTWPLDDSARREVGSATHIDAPPTRDEDRDGDGIVDRLDIVRGMHKLLLNHAAYHEEYMTIPYPMGDVPRTQGVCTDTIIRALRNAGLDLQRAVHEDIAAAPSAYPMVERVDASINHRRVKTLRAWFHRHALQLPNDGQWAPGDVVFLDTFPTRDGPEHIGLVSDHIGPDGRPLIVNNWTDGFVDSEMTLLGLAPVTDHFRIVPDRLLVRARPRGRAPR